MLYLDYCATTPPHEDVVQTVADVMRKHFGNPSSIHRLGVEAERLVRRAREVAADSLGCAAGEIIFTSGGTEGNNLAVKGTAYAYERRGRHLIASAVEHPSVTEPLKRLEQRGFRVTFIPVDATGAVNPDDIERAITDETTLVSVMHVNNEMGRIQPVADIGRMLRTRPRIVFHVDAVQAFGKLPVSPAAIGADLLTVSAHKLHGPKGAGFLYKREGLSLEPQQTGGGQEFGVRPGTENVPLIVGMAKAVRMAAEAQTANLDVLYGLRRRLVERLKNIDGVRLTGTPDETDMAPHIVHFRLPGIRSEAIVHALEQEDIYISTRSACSSGSVEPSRVLLAMGLGAEDASSGLRVSFGAGHLPEQMAAFADALDRVIRKLSNGR